ncbi:hypothetical protein CK203_016930 [Vitis vinifera]|uniref:DUF4283 domain-containing protein n=1 Tax=Vitis vinifera TaxID=29760 RepID=A0A438JNN9_VITVI|nr:hypothetical protein CK203_016930 [Vitis vinifera]
MGKGMEGAGENVLYDTRDKQSGGVYTARGLRSREDEVCIFIPRGRRDKRGWMTMAEKLNQMVIKKLEHCVVASWKDSSGGEDDLEKLGQLWAKSWDLKGSLGLAKLEKERALLEFEDLEEARRVVSSGNRAMEGIQVGLEHWSPRSGCWAEEEERKEVWVRIVGLPISLWSPEILKRWGTNVAVLLQSMNRRKRWVSSNGPESCDEGVGEREARDLNPSDEGTGEQGVGSGPAEASADLSPTIRTWASTGKLHFLSPIAGPKETRRVGGPGLTSGSMGFKMKGVATSEIGPEVGPSYRIEEVGCCAKGPALPIARTSNKGPNYSKGCPNSPIQMES